MAQKDTQQVFEKRGREYMRGTLKEEWILYFR